MAEGHYDIEADRRLKKYGRELCALTEPLTGLPDKDRIARHAAKAIVARAVGFLPEGAGPNSVPDEVVYATILRVQGMLKLVRAYARFAPRGSFGQGRT